MHARNNVTHFHGVTHVRPADTLDEKDLRRLMRHIGIGDHITLEEFKSTPLDVRAICPNNGIQVTGNKGGSAVPVWVSQRKLQPLQRQAEAA